MAPRRSHQRISNGLVALGSTAVFAVYVAGFVRTRAAAEKFEGQAVERRAAAPVVVQAPPRLGPAPAESSPSTAPKPAAERRPHDSAHVGSDHSRPGDHDHAPAPAQRAPARQAEAKAAPVQPPEPPPPQQPAAPQPPPAPKWKDGTYYGWGTSRHGDIQAAVVVEGGKITSASIAQCLTRYSCSWIAHLPPQVVVRQSEDVDYVSGATQSTYAFYYAVLDALAKAK